MVLGSQAPRSGMSRQYMVSRRRRPKRWPWVLLAVAGLAIAGMYFWSPDGKETSYAQSDAQDDAASANSVADAGPHTVEDMTPPRVLGQRSQQQQQRPAANTRQPAPNVPTFTLGSNSANANTNTQQANTTPAPRVQPRQQVTPTPAPQQPSNTQARPAPIATTPKLTVPAAGELGRGMRLIEEGKYVEGRRVLSRVLFYDRNLAPQDAEIIRMTLASVNEQLVFSPKVFPGDPLAESYAIQSGDLLAKIAPRFNLTYQFLEDINGVDARKLRVGQKIKLIRGPFHAIIEKSQYRMDIVLRGDDGNWVYVRSFQVGLGEGNSTPPGKWIIEPGRKVKNPAWRNPRTGEYYKPNDPANPIGEYWLALEGADQHTSGLGGYGIHGTVDPSSIGSQSSMGCVRLRDADIEAVYYLLVEGSSTVEIRP